ISWGCKTAGGGREPVSLNGGNARFDSMRRILRLAWRWHRRRFRAHSDGVLEAPGEGSTVAEAPARAAEAGGATACAGTSARYAWPQDGSKRGRTPSETHHLSRERIPPPRSPDP